MFVLKRQKNTSFEYKKNRSEKGKSIKKRKTKIGSKNNNEKALEEEEKKRRKDEKNT